MKPYYQDDWLTIYGGDVRDVLPTLPADSVDCIVTSPPYWGLRDYGAEGQLGLERTPDEYVANMVAVFREVRRVLKPSGTCWLNLGDSYAAGKTGRDDSGGNGRFGGPRIEPTQRKAPEGLKPKDLVGIPWRVAFALQADGWYLRSDIIWSKPNPMPESVTDRPTKSHEYLFLLTKQPKYYFDADAVREASITNDARRPYTSKGAWEIDGRPEEQRHGGKLRSDPAAASARNIRSVWTIATRPYPGAHFAVFPPELPERCIKAGSSERGVCPECGAPWERVVERSGYNGERADATVYTGQAYGHAQSAPRGPARNFGAPTSTTTGWRPTCAHTFIDPTDPDIRKYLIPEPAVVLDPFGGSGTVGMVANRLSRRAILIDLNPEYLKQQLKRNAQTPLGLGAA